MGGRHRLGAALALGLLSAVSSGDAPAPGSFFKLAVRKERSYLVDPRVVVARSSGVQTQAPSAAVNPMRSFLGLFGLGKGKPEGIRLHRLSRGAGGGDVGCTLGCFAGESLLALELGGGMTVVSGPQVAACVDAEMRRSAALTEALGEACAPYDITPSSSSASAAAAAPKPASAPLCVLRIRGNYQRIKLAAGEQLVVRGGSVLAWQAARKGAAPPPKRQKAGDTLFTGPLTLWMHAAAPLVPRFPNPAMHSRRGRQQPTRGGPPPMMRRRGRRGKALVLGLVAGVVGYVGYDVYRHKWDVVGLYKARGQRLLRFARRMKAAVLSGAAQFKEFDGAAGGAAAAEGDDFHDGGYEDYDADMNFFGA
uniref:Altered inheritance of mitochondria protein 24, mitochondrial n=2 Tax=Phaeomonas parva TaxID=124430 RepID=A0A6U4IYT9_9STRA|mmetsp:Transcript_41576/g.130214  ORF Transcript_41576/g.130214 Transcript_41576/m.130214 type:complete len:365 (+) Transcript_41576:101-1195(+)